MTHHANDERFDFLQGRYRTTWMKVKEKVRRDEARPKEEKAMGALVGGYESGDEEEEERETPPRFSSADQEILPPSSSSPKIEIIAGGQVSNPPAQMMANQGEVEVVVDEEAERERKRVRLRRLDEWKKKRAKEKDLGGLTS